MEFIATIFFSILAIGFVLDVVVIALFVHVARKARDVRPDILGAPSQASAATAATARAAAVREAWDAIRASAGRGIEGRRLAVIDADRLVDRLLKDAGYEGEGALDRMKALPGERVATAAGLMHAHRYRNRLVHEQGFAPDERDLDGALAQYEAFLTEVGYL